jgi:hypothetical protein
MKSAVPKPSLGSEFDNFLFTALGDDRNGLPVSVISLLARMNLDPWQEAGTLATLSAEAAARRLASSLDTLTDENLRQRISETRVKRLLALLPTGISTPLPATTTGAGAMAPPESGMRIGMIVFITSAIFLVASRIFAAHPDSPILPGAVPGPAVLTAPSHTLTPPPAH